MNNEPTLTVNNLCRELQLILEIIRADKPQMTNIKYENIDWDHFISLTFHHRIFSYIYPKMKHIYWVPSQVQNKLKQQYQINTFRMLQLCGEMEKMNTVFWEHQIPLLFLKGPVLAKSLYGDISLRTSCDLDVLISIDDLEKAENLLIQHGYVKDEYIESVLNDWKWRHHHITFYHSEKAIKFELHWRLHPGPGAESSFSELWSRRRNSTITSSTSIHYLGAEDLFVFLAVHGARHGWSRLRWLIDIKKMVDIGLDSQLLHQFLRKNQCTQLGGQALILASELMNTSIPSNLRYLMHKKKSRHLAHSSLFYLTRLVNLHTDPLDETVSTYHGKYLLSLKSVRQKFLFYLSCLHPYSMDAKIFPLPKGIHFLYFPLRPFLWALRHKKKDVLS